MPQTFTLARTPDLHFGKGKISVLTSVIQSFGSSVLLITGAQSFMASPIGTFLMEDLSSNGINVSHCSIGGEPTPTMIDAAVNEHSDSIPDVVLAIGGGSALDAGKAISAMLLLKESVKDYLEGVGTKRAHPGVKVPFIAIPTTSGTGAEATKNAVISEVGAQGYKRSLRHNNFVPDVAIVDPSLTVSCPPSVTAASGMDAFTQLLESYLSTASNSITDALAVEGLKHVSSSLIKAYRDGSDVEARTGMALASYLSGVTLANAGLGLVHGFASSIGGFFDIPHGVICSSLMPAANSITVRKLRVDKKNKMPLSKYTTVGKIFSSVSGRPDDYYIDSLLNLMESWADEMKIPHLIRGGVDSSSFERIVAVTDNKNNPVALNKDEMIEVLELTG